MDVTGAGNAFLGGLAAGLHLSDGDVFEGAPVGYSGEALLKAVGVGSLYAAISAAFTIEQAGLPQLSGLQYRTGQGEMWNEDMPRRRLKELRERVEGASVN